MHETTPELSITADTADVDSHSSTKACNTGPIAPLAGHSWPVPDVYGSVSDMHHEMRSVLAGDITWVAAQCSMHFL